MDEIPAHFGSSGALARRLLHDFRNDRADRFTIDMWIRNWRAAGQGALAEAVEAAIANQAV